MSSSTLTPEAPVATESPVVPEAASPPYGQDDPVTKHPASTIGEVRTRTVKGEKVVEAKCRFSDSHDPDKCLPLDAEHWNPHRASGRFHLRSRCKSCETAYRLQLRENLKSGDRTVEARGGGTTPETKLAHAETKLAKLEERAAKLADDVKAQKTAVKEAKAEVARAAKEAAAKAKQDAADAAKKIADADAEAAKVAAEAAKSDDDDEKSDDES